MDLPSPRVSDGSGWKGGAQPGRNAHVSGLGLSSSMVSFKASSVVMAACVAGA